MLRVATCVFVWLTITAPLSAAFWKPVTPEELALAQPRVDPEAGVEILFRETEIDDSLEKTTNYHTYVRLKVFNARGVAALDKIEIVETRDAPIINLAARVIRPDGTVVDVPRSTIYAREMLRHGSLRVKAKAFSPPGLEPGCLVEYQWDEKSENSIGGLQLYFQDRFPAWRVRFRIKPFNYEGRGYELVPAGFRYEIPELKPDSQGFYPFAQVDVPALRNEPWMPPDDMVQSWMVLYFLRRGQKPENFWKETGRALALETTKQTRPTPELKALARARIADAVDERDQVQRLGIFCRDEIANLTARPAASLRDPRPSLSRPRSAFETLAARAGTAQEINLLFIALARAAGFEARLACVTDRSKRLFREPLPARFMLPDTLAAVRMGGAWQFFDPSRPDVTMGRLAWENEGVTALVCDRARSEFVHTPRPPRSASGVARRARLALDAAGTATGLVVLEYRGHAAVAQRQEFADLTSEQRAARMYHAEAARYEGVELGDVTVQHATEPELPVVVSYPVRVPHYATATETRLVFPLAYFQRGLAPIFAAPVREHVVYLAYESSEDDSVEFILPSGYELEEAAEPASFALPPALEYRVTLARDATGARLAYRRTVNYGGMLFPATTYRLLKPAFDHLHHQDGHVAIARRLQETPPAAADARER